MALHLYKSLPEVKQRSNPCMYPPIARKIHYIPAVIDEEVIDVDGLPCTHRRQCNTVGKEGCSGLMKLLGGK